MSRPSDLLRSSWAWSGGTHALTLAFLCAHCGNTVPAESFGTRQRNHWPRCLHSLFAVGDRRSLCRGLMEPIAAWSRGKGEVALVHRCACCGGLRSNRVAGDDEIGALLKGLRKAAERVEAMAGAGPSGEDP